MSESHSLSSSGGLKLRVFSGIDDSTPVEAWTRSFKIISKHSGWDDAFAIDMFSVNLVGGAAAWFLEYLHDVDTADYKIDDWITALNTAFVVPREVMQYKVDDLNLIIREKEERMSIFNSRFTSFLSKIPKTKYTDEGIKDKYMENLFKSDLEVYKEIVKFNESRPASSLKEMMAAADKWYQRLNPLKSASIPQPSTSSSLFASSSDSSKSHGNLIDQIKNSNSKNSNSDYDSVLDNLSKQVEKLTLVVEKSTSNNYKKNLQCFNCGNPGHVVSQCRLPENISLQNQLKKQYNDKKNSSTNTAATLVVLPNVPKRPRTEINISDLLDDENLNHFSDPSTSHPSYQHNTTPINNTTNTTSNSTSTNIQNSFSSVGQRPTRQRPVPRLGVVVNNSNDANQPHKSQKKKKKNIFPSTLFHEFLNQNVPVTYKEFLIKYPKEISGIIRGLKSIEKSRKRRTPVSYGLSALYADEDSDEDDDDSDNNDFLFESLFDDQPQSSAKNVSFKFDSPLSFVLTKYKDHKIPLFVDTGAYTNLILKKWVNEFGFIEEVHSSNVSITIANSSNIKINSFVSVPLFFADDIQIVVKFNVVDSLPVPFILGLDWIQSHFGILDYSVGIFNFKFADTFIQSQLYSRNELISVFNEQYDEVSPTLLALSSNADITDEGLPSYTPSDFKFSFDQINIGNHITDEQKSSLITLMKSYHNLFPKSLNDLDGINDFLFDINLDSSFKSFSSRLRRFNPDELAIIKEEIDKMLEAGVIAPSKSSVCSQIVLVPKPDGSSRFCIDFRPLNSFTIKDRFPLANVNDCLDSLSGKKYFTLLDCFSGYWQVKLKDDISYLTAFISPYGLYEFKRLPFGLSNAPSYFSRMMSIILAPYLFDFVTVYIDDISIASNTFDEHLEHIKLVFESLSKYNVRLKLKKCFFFASEFKYLGFVVTDKGIIPNPEKVAALRSLSRPKNIKDVRSLIGLASYFRRFIPNFTNIVYPILDLLKKKNYFDWTDECSASFITIVNALSSSPVLKQPDWDHEFVLSTDASSFAIGAVLEQYDDHGNLLPVFYYSRRLLAAEMKYSTYDKECLALVSAIKFFRHYLIYRKFKVFTDNSAVASIFNQKEPIGRVARWIFLLSEFDFELHHRSGKSNVVADFISRHPVDDKNNIKGENFNLKNINPNNFSSFGPCLIATSNALSFTKLKAFLSGDQNAITDKKFRLLAKRFCLIDNILFRKRNKKLLKVIESTEQLYSILNILHDQLSHSAFDTIWNWMSCRYWRPHLYSEVKHFVSSCKECQFYYLGRPRYKFDGKSSVSGFLSTWHVDFLGPFPASSKGFKYVYSAVDSMNIPYLFPVSSTTIVDATTATLYLLATFGVPKTIYCDRASCFASSAFINRFARFGINIELNVAYQPEWMGRVESLNRVVRYALSKRCNGDYENWDSFIPEILLALRSKPSSNGHSPFKLLYGFTNPILNEDHDISLPSNVDARLMEIESVPGLRNTLLRNSVSASKSVSFPVGSFVLVLNEKLRKYGVYDKKKPRYFGPFRVTAVMPHSLFEIVSQTGVKNVYHASRLIAFIPRGIPFSGGSVRADSDYITDSSLETHQRQTHSA